MSRWSTVVFWIYDREYTCCLFFKRVKQNVKTRKTQTNLILLFLKLRLKWSFRQHQPNSSRLNQPRITKLHHVISCQSPAKLIRVHPEQCPPPLRKTISAMVYKLYVSVEINFKMVHVIQSKRFWLLTTLIKQSTNLESV